MFNFINRTGRATAVVTLFGAFLSTVALQPSQARQAVPSATPVTAPAKHSVDQTDARIKRLHDQLRITADQETKWVEVAQAMRVSAKTIRDSVADRAARLKTMNAVEDLKSYETVATDHADGLKRLVPAFEALYGSMTPAQQKHADHVFSERQQHTS